VASPTNMAYIDDINYQDTRKKKHIVFKSKWMDLTDLFVFMMIPASLIMCEILLVKEADLKSPNDSFVVYWIFPFLTVFILILLYKKLTEKRLLVIETKLEKTEARKQILVLVKSWQWEIHRNNPNYLQATTGMELASWGKQVIIIYDNQKIYLNVMSNNPKVRMPVLFSDKSIKNDIEKQLKASH
jgi:hypothetical protein